MDKSEETYLLELWERNICPYCGKSIPEGTRVGRGQKRLGGFCSLECLTLYYELEFIERAQHVKGIFKRQEDS